MMNHQRFLDISEADSLSSFEKLLVDFAGALDFGIVAAALVVDRPGSESTFLALGNTPSDFADASRSVEDSKRDPVLKRLKRMSTPFIYDQDMFVSEGAGDLWEQQAEYGYKTGISVALHLPGNKHFLLGVDRDDPLPKDETKVVRMLADLQLAAVHAQDAALRLLGSQVVVPSLSARELEILKWSIEGKSASVVGQILGISAATVNYHVGRILVKLECESKHQAILKAMALGLL